MSGIVVSVPIDGGPIRNAIVQNRQKTFNSRRLYEQMRVRRKHRRQIRIARDDQWSGLDRDLG
jgi:hypothetical protein